MHPLGHTTVGTFLERHWQRRPLLARGTLAEPARAITPETLFRLAARDDVESRLVQRTPGGWSLGHGPFSRAALARLPQRNWTLLVNGLDLHLPAARRLADCFRFIPYARHDDVMASYAVPGGGVGPHFDSYDVFLVQGTGRRRWRVSAQRDLTLRPNLPLRILRSFRATRQWTVEPGDLLYLPPRYAHDGVAIDPCVTISVGCRAPAARELARGLLEFVADHLQLAGLYADAGLARPRHPAALPADLVDYALASAQRARWNRATAERFLGAYLTEPKPHVFFAPPARPLAHARFAALLARRGARLALKTRMLYAGRRLFINGEEVTAAAAVARSLRDLADHRRVPPDASLTAAARTLLYQWYLAGYLELGHAG